MVLRLKEQALMFEKPSDIVTTLSQKGETQFLSSIMGEYAKELYVPGMNSSIRNGARRIQEIAYLPIKEKKKEEEVKASLGPIYNGINAPIIQENNNLHWNGELLIENNV